MEINAYITPKLNVKEVATICAALLSREKPYEEALAQRLAEELYLTPEKEEGHPYHIAQPIMYSRRVPAKGVWGQELVDFLTWLNEMGIRYESGRDEELILRAAGEEVIVEPGHVILVTQGGGIAILKDEL